MIWLSAPSLPEKRARQVEKQRLERHRHRLQGDGDQGPDGRERPEHGGVDHPAC
ncbi:MAG: hypothetical protein MZV70_12925 [Desulfobacterales bacterium]|nr:hypothetical protein [Desulfobacterales bacterium]